MNYKDAPSASGNRGVTRTYPHTPGIDAVGTIVSSNTDKFQKEEDVIVTSYDLGMNTSGGFGQFIRVPSSWALKLPTGMMTMKESMILGTAGLTAGMSVAKLISTIKPGQGPVVVSGATGGVGVLSVAILAKLGYHVSSIAGKEREQDFLRQLGARDVILRKDFKKENARPILKGCFAGGIDAAGGPVLDNMIKSTQPLGVVTCCGNVASPHMNMTVFPFILRGVSLIGIDSQNCPMNHREVIWNRLAKDWRPKELLSLFKEVSLSELGNSIRMMQEGQMKGRIIMNLGT